MQVAAVGVEGALPVGDAPEEGEGRVRERDGQGEHRHDEADDRVELEQAEDRHGREDEAQQLRAHVAHEDLGGVEVIGHEAEAGAHQRGQQD